MKESFKTINIMEKGDLCGLQVLIIKGVLNMENLKDKEQLHFQMDLFTKVAGKMVNGMELEENFIKKEVSDSEITNTDKE